MNTTKKPKNRVVACLSLVDRIFNCKGTYTDETRRFQGISHEALCQALQYWLEQMRITISEPINIVITQSLRDEGIDVLLEFLKSKVKIGFQIKSYNDINQKEFTQSCIAQISRSRKHNINRLIIGVGADLTDVHQREKVRGLTSEISQMGDFCFVFSPEKTLTIFQTFEKKEHPITLVEGTGDALLIIHELQKKLSQDQYYDHKISWKSTLKEKYRESGNPVEFKMVVNQPPGSKNILDILKEISLTGKSFTIPAENVEKFEVIKDGKVVTSDKKITPITITPEKRKITLTLETIDFIDNSLLHFENIIFVVDSVVGTTVYLSTHDNALPYQIQFCVEIEGLLGNFSAAIKDPASVSQRYKLMRFVAAIHAGKELILKSPNGDAILVGQSNVNLEAIPKRKLELFQQLNFIQEKTGKEIYPPKTLMPEDLKNITFAYELLTKGKAEIKSFEFSNEFNKSEAISFLQLFKQGKMRNCALNDVPVEIELFGKKMTLGLGIYRIPEAILVEDLTKVEKSIEHLGENRKIIKITNAPNCLVTVKLYDTFSP
jgi:hypothetical protein